MDAPGPSSVRVGDTLGPLRLPPVSRLTLALFCGASNDHNPIHVDLDVARAAGLDDVIGHGMLSMAYLGRLLTSWTPQGNIRVLQCRFLDPTRIGDIPVLTGQVVEESQEGNERRIRLALWLEDQAGNVKVRGHALVALSE